MTHEVDPQAVTTVLTAPRAVTAVAKIPCFLLILAENTVNPIAPDTEEMNGCNSGDEATRFFNPPDTAVLEPRPISSP